MKDTMKREEWLGPYRGDEIEARLLTRVPPKSPCVYLWRRVLPLDDVCFLNIQDFEGFIHKHTSSKFLKSVGLALSSSSDEGNICIRPDFLRIREVEIGGGVLSDEKGLQLKALTEIEKRVQLLHFLQDSTSRFGPVLYVGETDCLLTRIRKHICDGSPLRRRLEHLGLTINDTMFSCYLLEDQNKHLRKLFEQILTHLLVSPLTFRAG